MSDLPLKATLKAGTGFDAPWITVDANDPAELVKRLQGLADAGAYQAVADASSLLIAAGNATPVTHVEAPQETISSGGWGGTPTAQQHAVAAHPQASTPRQGATLHPTGESCKCGKVLEFGVTRTNKGQWKCPDYRWRNGDPNDHRLEWANS